ncbi:MAG: ATP-binding protein [Opitutaceae bacterium]
MTSLNSSAVRASQVAANILALLVTAVGGGSFLGWVFDNEILKSPLQDGITIKANASLGLIFAGAGLFFLQKAQPGRTRVRTLGRICAVLALSLGALTVFQHLSGVDLGIDQLIFRETPGALATASPGRMGLPASVCLFLGGVALLLLDGRTARRRFIGQILGLSICVFTQLPLIGYAFGASQLYAVAGYTGIAMHTAVALLLWGVGILASRPTEGVMAILCADDAGGLMARRLVPAAFSLPIVTWLIRIYAEKEGWVEPSLIRPLAVLFLSVCSVVVVLWNARGMSGLETQRRRLEVERQRGFERTIEILESISDAFYAIDAAGRFTYVNRQAEELWGRSRDSLLGQSLWSEFPEAVNDAHPAHREVLSLRQPRRYETFSPRLSRWFDVSLYPEAGGGVSGFFRDVTERRHVEEELRRARDAAENANQAKSEFLATLSHEIRTPLNPVVLTLDYLEAHPEFPAKLRGELASIRRHVDLEIQLISDLLDITRIESGKLQLNLRDVDLHEVMQAVVVMCRRTDGPEIQLELGTESHFVRADPVRLHQVVWNLLNNAQKFTESGGRVVLRTAAPQAGRIRIEVTDNGRGIAPELMPKLFNAFEQGETLTARQRGGLGLGLTITRKIVEAHGGTVTAASRGAGEGAQFTVELPTLAERPGLPPPPTAAVASEAANPLRILLVEDHAPTLKAMLRLLKMIGHQITTATTCAEAERAALAGDFDLLISDLGLPDESGLELMKRVRPRFPGRAIAITGYGTEQDIQAAREAGFAEHLTKPVQISLLKAAIVRVAGAKRRSPSEEIGVIAPGDATP